MILIQGIIASSIQNLLNVKIDNNSGDYSTVIYQLCSFSVPETEIPSGWGYFKIEGDDFATAIYQLCSFSAPETEIPSGWGYFSLSGEDLATATYELCSFSVPETQLPGSWGYFTLSGEDLATATYELCSFSVPGSEFQIPQQNGYYNLSSEDFTTGMYQVCSFSLPENLILTNYTISATEIELFRTSIYGVSTNAENILGFDNFIRPSFTIWQTTTGSSSLYTSNLLTKTFWSAYLSGGNMWQDASLNPLSARLLVPGKNGILYQTKPILLRPYSSILDIPNLQIWLDATSGVDSFVNPTIDQFLDSSSNNLTITRVGNPAQGTFSPFFPNGAVYNPAIHGGSCYFGGNGNYLHGSNALFNVGAADSTFTFECWVYPRSTSNGAFFAIGSGVAWSNSIALYYGRTANKFTFLRGNSSGSNPVTIVSGNNYLAENWYHVAVTKTSAGVHTLYINGIADGTQTHTSNLAPGATTFVVNGVNDNVGLGNSGSTFYVSNLRFINGMLAYTSNFSVPTSPVTLTSNGGATPSTLPTSGQVSLLLNFTNGLLLDGTADNNFQRFGDATIVNTVKKYGLGAMYFDGNGDYFEAPAKQDYNLGTGDFTIECWVKFNELTSGFDGIIDSGSTINSVNNTQWGLYRSGTTLTFGRHGGTILLTYSTSSMNTQAWYHIAVTRQSDNLSMFVDGVRVATNYFPGWAISGSPVRIGAISSPYYMNGYIDDVRITRGIARYGSQTSLLLNANGTNGGNNNFIADSSSNNFTITRNGDPTPSALTPFAGTGGSVYFDGGSTLTTPNFTWSSGDFTIETWVNFNTIDNVYGVYSPNNQYIFDTGSGNMTMIHVIGGRLQFYINGTLIISYTLNPVVGVWYHIAVSRQSNIVRMFVNGTFVGTSVTSSVTPSTGIIRIGNTLFNGGAYNAFLNGYLSNFRIVNGTAVYTSNFTPPTSPLTNITNTALLLSTPQPSVIDSSNKNPVIYTLGNAQLSAGQSVFGGTSLYFDGNGDYLSIPASSNLTFGTEDFTIESWVYRNLNTEQAYITNADGPLDNNYYVVGVSNNGGARFQIRNSAGTQFFVSSPANAVPVNQWTHIAATRESGVMKLFINGTQVGTPLANSTNISQRNTIVGAFLYPGFTGFFNGYIDDLRIVKGAALYTSNFTPPTSQLTTNVTSASVAPFTPPNEFANSSTGDSNFSNVVALVQANQETNEIRWRDKSPTQNHAFQISGSRAPILSANAINSLSGVVFNGTTNLMDLTFAIPLTSQNATTFFVYTRPSSGIVNTSLGDKTRTLGGISTTVQWTDNRIYAMEGYTTGGKSNIGPSIVGATKTPRSLYLTQGGSLVKQTDYAAGWGQSDIPVNVVGSYGGFLNRGAIGEIVYANCSLPDQELLLVGNSLRTKWMI